eukprot:5301348-Prorocentrum_lima.AAC.1
MARKLANLDIRYQVVRHMTALSVHALGVSLKEQLLSPVGGAAPGDGVAMLPASRPAQIGADMVARQPRV